MANALERKGDESETSILDLNLFPSRDSDDAIITKQISPAQLRPYLRGLKVKYFSISGAVSNAIYARCSGDPLTPLSNLISLSFPQHNFPNSLKIAQTTPVFKHGSKTDPKNFRSISQLPEPGNIIEKIFKDRLYLSLEETQYLTPAQYGSRSKLSTSSALFGFVSIVQRLLDAKTLSAALFIDIAKAFDTVYHLIIRELIRTFLPKGDILWLQSYLSSRRQYVKIGNHPSDIGEPTHGVPQGSVLDPVFFLIFINQIGSLSLKGKLFLLADGITIVYTGPDLDFIQINIRSDCLCLTKFINSLTLKLTANSLKTKLLVFSKSRRVPNFPFSVQFHGQDREYVSSIKFLGLCLDSSLPWENYIKHGRPLKTSFCSSQRSLKNFIFFLNKVSDVKSFICLG